MTPTDPLLAIIPTETCVCMRCSGAIPRECTASRIVQGSGYGPTRRSLKAYCEHCNRLYEARSVLRNGYWEIDGPAKEIIDKSGREGMLARIAHLRGEARINSSHTQETP